MIERTPVDVAVGVLIRDDGRFLITSRPAGKVYAGHWEFPGGKVEPGESIEAALKRELHEELGISIGAAEAWKTTLHDYPHALVRLHFCKVYAWTGAFEMREQQQMAWQTLPVEVVPLLPGSLPVLAWLAEERGFVGATHQIAHHVGEAARRLALMGGSDATATAAPRRRAASVAAPRRKSSATKHVARPPRAAGKAR